MAHLWAGMIQVIMKRKIPTHLLALGYIKKRYFRPGRYKFF
jgi:hypothetical protein